MFTQYHDLDISFSMEHTRFRVLNVARERLERIIPSHSHGADSYEIHYNFSGRGQLLSEGHLWELTPGSLYLVGPHVAHAQIPDPDDAQVDDCIYLHLTPSDRGDASEDRLTKCFANQTFWIGRDRQDMAPLLNRLLDEFKGESPGRAIWVETLLKQLIVSVVRNLDDPPAAESFRAATPEEAQVFRIEEAFLYEYPVLTLDGLAGRLGLSARQTQRLLLARYGKTFQQKRMEARMSAASILLTRTHRTIAAIACELGYSTPEHFTTAFRREFGCPAAEYRRKFAIPPASGAEPVLDPPEGLGSAIVPARNR